MLPTRFEVAGKAYGINLTDWDARELEAIGFSVYSFAEHEASLEAVFGRSKLLSDVLLYLCKPESDESFLRGLDFETMEAARLALKNAIVNFTPAASRQTVSAVLEQIEKALSNLDTLPQLTN